MNRARATALGSLLLAAFVAACGKKGDPTPPLPRGPRAVSDLAVEQEGDEAVLTFSYPDRLLTGGPLTDLAAIEVYRASGAAATQAAPRPRARPRRRPTRRPSRRRAMRRRRRGRANRPSTGTRRLVASLSAAALGEYARGASVVYRDPLRALLEAGKTPSLGYSVVSVRRNGEKSPLSNIVALSPEVPPDAPVIVSVLVEEGRICLDWTAPAKDLLGKPADVGGYFVYRRTLPQEEYERPLNPSASRPPATWTRPSATARPTSTRCARRLSASRWSRGRRRTRFRSRTADVYPPPAPARLDALSEGNLVRLVWDPVTASDVVGYLVFRAEGDGPPAKLERQAADRHVLHRSVTPARDAIPLHRARRRRAGNLGPPSPEAVAEPF